MRGDKFNNTNRSTLVVTDVAADSRDLKEVFKRDNGKGKGKSD